MSKTNLQQIRIPSILKIGEDELGCLGTYLKNSGFENIAIFYSAGIEDICGEKIDLGLEKAGIRVLHKDSIVEINIDNIIHTAFSITKSVDVLVGVGGGKALDYCKYCAHVLALPFVSVPTSISNDGFCSPISSLLVDEKRKTVKATIPYGVVVDIDVVKDSPENSLYSGIGDLISKITAGWDWKAAFKLEGEEFHDFAYLISQNTVIEIMNYQYQDIRDSRFVYHLANSLLMNGIAMEIAGSSRPASGSEHLISHSLDLIAKKPNMHGIQVGVATYLCSYLQDNQFELVKNFLTNTGFFDYMFNNPLDREEFIQAIKIAPKAKENFYSVLSIPGNIERAINFATKDEILTSVLV